MTNLSNNIISYCYLFIWILTFIWYHWKYRVADAGTVIIGLYILYAIFSILTVNDALIGFMYNPLQVYPYLYLYVMLMIALTPTIYNHFHPVQKLQESPTRLLNVYAVFVILLSLLLVPDIVDNFSEGLVKIVTDTDAGREAYEDSLEDKMENGYGSQIGNLSAIIFNAFYDVTIFVAFYMMTLKRKNIFLVVGIFISVVIGLMLPIMKGARGSAYITLCTLLGAFMLFKPYLSRLLVRVVSIVGIVGGLLILIPIAAITMSRFGERVEGVSSFITWYMGQGNVYFNNFGLNAGGIRYGDRTINFVKRAIDPDTPKNFAERRMKYHNLEMDDDRFTTFVGDFCIDFGPVVAFLIFLIFNFWVLIRIRGRGDPVMPVHRFLLIYFTQCICLQGGMYLFAYSDTGNFKIVTMFLVYSYLCYHECLVALFPKNCG